MQDLLTTATKDTLIELLISYYKKHYTREQLVDMVLNFKKAESNSIPIFVDNLSEESHEKTSTTSSIVSSNISNKTIHLRALNMDDMKEMLTKIDEWDNLGKKVKQETNIVDLLKDVVDFIFPDYTLGNSTNCVVEYKGDKNKLREILNPKIKDTSSYYWYNCDMGKKPEILNALKGHVWITTKKIAPRYPIFIISKGRWEQRLTVKALQVMNVKFRVVIEEQEYKEYSKVIDIENIIVMPKNLCDLGEGSIPVRNFVFEFAKKEGHKRHWILDDNITKFDRYTQGEKIPVKSGVCFRVIEDYVDKFTNVMMAGMQYCSFSPEISKNRPIVIMNTRIYSCILLSCESPYQWRGRYNEDTDLSLRLLKDGYPTILFQNFLCNKLTTMTCKGGNTDSIYKNDGLMKKFMALQEMHPDVVKFTDKRHKDGRPHHTVNYKPFKKNILIKANITPKLIAKEYYMTLHKETDKEIRKILSITK